MTRALLAFMVTAAGSGEDGPTALLSKWDDSWDVRDADSANDAASALLLQL